MNCGVNMKAFVILLFIIISASLRANEDKTFKDSLSLYDTFQNNQDGKR